MVFSGLTSLVDLSVDKLSSEGQLILIEDSNTDGSFLLHHFISSFIRENGTVCIIGFAQTFVHYNTIGKKLGINLSSEKENGKLIFVDGMHMFLECLQNESSEPFSVERLYNKVASICRNVSNDPFLLVIDNLKFLINGGINAERVADFIHYCHCLASHPQHKWCLLALLHCDTDIDDEDAIFLSNHLKYEASIQISVKGLETGYSKDVHGEVEVQCRQPMNPHIITPVTKIMQYKLNDKDVDFFPLGMSSAVL